MKIKRGNIDKMYMSKYDETHTNVGVIWNIIFQDDKNKYFNFYL